MRFLQIYLVAGYEEPEKVRHTMERITKMEKPAKDLLKLHLLCKKFEDLSR